MQVVRALEADEDVANCCAPHPHLPVLATSGIETVVKIWAPLSAPVPTDAHRLITRNQDRMREAPSMLRSINPRLIQVGIINSCWMESSLPWLGEMVRIGYFLVKEKDALKTKRQVEEDMLGLQNFDAEDTIYLWPIQAVQAQMNAACKEWSISMEHGLLTGSLAPADLCQCCRLKLCS